MVSCQAPAGSPLAATPYLVALARAAELGGACAIRAEGGDAVAAMKEAVGLPVIGLRKRPVEDSDVYITPEVEDARAVARAGADMVAVDATLRRRPGGLGSASFLAELAGELEQPVVADVDCFEAGVVADAAGAAAVATTLSGYTDDGAPPEEPDLELVARLAGRLDCPVLAEGRYATPESVRDALDVGAFAVVVGSAITDPVALTRRFAAACEGAVRGTR